MYFALERVRKIIAELKDRVYSDRVIISAFQMKEGHFRRKEEADVAPGEWTTLHSGELWGGRDRYYWLRTKIRVPDRFDGKTIALTFSTWEEGWDATNPQFLCYLDGELLQGLDLNHREVFVTEQAQGGREYQLDLAAYSGMLERRSFLHGELVTVDRQTRRLYFNLQVPLWVVERLSEQDKKRFDLLTILNQTVNLLDLRKPFSDQYYDSINRANSWLEEELYHKLGGQEEVIATCVGHTHIDVAWLWTVAQTREKVARSFSTVLRLMKEYPEYLFISSQPLLYTFIKEDYPQLYQQIKEKVQAGVWEPEGAMWLEADCNLTSGESLVRQLLFGTRFFAREFGVKSELLWLPDVFGYSAALPQILKKSGINYFMTTKLSWNQFNKIPYDTFQWQGIDGSEVLTYFVTTQNPEQDPASFYTTYNGDLHPGALIGGWNRYQQKELNNELLVCFGYGDGGGGPTIEMLEAARRMSKGLPGCPRVQMGKAGDFFRRLARKVEGNMNLPKWVGELYFEYHRGTYTSMARNKRYNRKCELLFHDVETLSILAMLWGKAYPAAEINRSWRTILLNQFHDILPGSSIKEVYTQAKAEYEQVLAAGRKMAAAAINAITDRINLDRRTVVVINTLSHRRDDLAFFTMPEGIERPCLSDDQGNKYPCQVIQSSENQPRQAVFFASEIPAKGYKVFILEQDDSRSDPRSGFPEELAVSTHRLENKYFRIDLDERGTITSLYDKLAQRQVLKEGARGNTLLAFEDKPIKFENWDLDLYYQEKWWEIDQVESIKVLENGPVRGGLEIRKRFLDSVLIQKMYIYQDLPRIDFDTYIDWKERQILLKAAFPVDLHAEKATYDIQFGNVERPTHWNTSWDVARFEVYAHKWADLSEEGYGVSLLNDCKYGHDIKDGVMRLTLLKSGIDPNPEADQEEHYFTYSIYPHQGGWREAGTVKKAYNFNLPLYAKVETPHAGDLPQEFSLVTLDQENIILETVKKAEDSDDLILRLYEGYNKRTKVRLNFGLEINQVMECNLMEKESKAISTKGSGFSCEFRPYEIKTFKVKLKLN